MNTAQQPQEQQGSGITLAQINEMLNGAGFPIINPQRVHALQELAPRERIIRAIKAAKHDPGARTFLSGLFQQAGITLDVPPATPSQAGYQEPPAPAQPAMPQQSYPPATGRHSSGQQPIQNSNEGYANGGQGNDSPRMNPEDRMSVHVYGGKAALCFEADITKGGVPTIALDAATATAPRQYDWTRKVRLQMTRHELPVVAAVLLGVMPSCEFKNHGQDNSKGFSIERQQGGKVYIKVFAKNEGVRGVPVMAPDVFYVTALLMRQLQKANPWLDGTSLMSLIKATQYQH
jgi:hypothetical protein